MSADPPYHSCLSRQLRRLGLSPDTPPATVERWSTLLRRVSDCYTEADADRYTLERSIEISGAEMRALHDILSEQAQRDELTGLPNRLALTELLGDALARRRAGGREVAVLFIDLDGFKLVNDSLGHAAGDELLVRTAERIRTSIRGDDVVARLGGDEFVVLCPDVAEIDTAIEVARRIAGRLDEPFRIAGQDASVSASIGITLTGTFAAPSAEEALREADIAMYEAKMRGRAQFAIYSDEMRSRVTVEMSTQNALRTAVEHDELRLHYQPIVRLSDRRPVGMEALLRWERPGFGLVPPDQFIPVAERSRLITGLDAWVLQEACRAAATWPDHLVVVTVNLSARDVQHENFAGVLSAALQRAHLEPRRLVLELTESTVMSGNATITANLAVARSMGVQLAIDDFGIGYSSLSALRQLPVQTLKIDRSFVAAMGQEPAAVSIVNAIIRMGHALGLLVVAEGVEDEAQAKLLKDLGCDAAQGYLFSRPEPLARLGRFLDAADVPQTSLSA